MQFPTQKFLEFARQYDVPDYVRAAHSRTFEEVDDPRSKEACYLAKFASLTGESDLSAAEQRKRAQILNIEGDISELETNYADFKQKSAVKTAAPTEKYPLRNKNEFMAAMGWLKKNAYAIALPERRELAERLIKKAEEYDMSIDEQLVKLAGLGVGDVNHIIPNLYKRADLIRISKLNSAEQREKTAVDLEALAEIAKMQPNRTIETENLDKISATLQFLDNEYGLHQHYTDGYIDPPDSVVFVHSHKTAEEIEKYACALGDEVYDVRDFEQLKIADIMDTFGEDFVTVMSDGLTLSHSKIADVIDVMTPTERSVFTDLVKEAGIKPQYFRKETVNLKELTKLFA